MTELRKQRPSLLTFGNMYYNTLGPQGGHSPSKFSCNLGSSESHEVHCHALDYFELPWGPPARVYNVMEQKALETTPTLTFLNKETGLLETRNAITGDLIALQSTPDPLAIKSERAVVAIHEGKKILVEPGVSLDVLEKGRSQRHKWVYSNLMGELICQKIIEGLAISKICDEPGMPPYNSFLRWKRENSSFAEMVKQAYEARGEYHRDEVLRIAQEYESEPENVAGAKLAVDAHKWLATADNSARFGSKTKVEAEIKGVIKFVVDTGIRRPDDPGYNKDQTKLAQKKDIEVEATKVGDIAPVRDDH